MARFPIPTPAWYDRPYASYGDAWWEACDQARRTLHHWASARRYGTYTELCRSVTAIPWDPVEGPYTHGGQLVGMLLGQISLSELAGSDDLPIISALVVGADEGQPVGGFWSLCDDTLKLGIGTDPMDRLAFWTQELKRCWDVFGTVA